MTLEERFDKLEERLRDVETACIAMAASNRMSARILKYVVLPLIIILGGLVGIKVI